MFRVLKHPHAEFYQCTQLGYFENIFNNETIITPIQAEKIYNSFFLLVVYVIPLLVIVVTYMKILCKMLRISKSKPVMVSILD